MIFFFFNNVVKEVEEIVDEVNVLSWRWNPNDCMEVLFCIDIGDFWVLVPLLIFYMVLFSLLI